MLLPLNTDVVFRVFAECYAGTILSCFINAMILQHTRNAFDVVSLVLAIGLTVLFIGYPLLVTIDLLRKFDTLPEVDLHARHPRWLRGVRVDTKGRALFQTLFFTKRLAIAFMLTFWDTWTWTQIFIINAMNTISLISCLLLWPYEKQQSNIILLVTEVGTLLIGILMVFINAEMGSEGVGMFMIVMIFGIIIGTISVEFTFTVIELCRRCKTKKRVGSYIDRYGNKV